MTGSGALHRNRGSAATDSRHGGWLRSQLPVYSPIEIAAGVRELLRDPIPRLEDLLRKRYGATSARLFGSGTDALTAAMSDLPARRAERPIVALPAYGCFDLATAALGASVLVRFYDLDPHTLGPDWQSLEAARRDGVDAVVVAPLYGVPVAWDRALEALGADRPLLIEDAAQAFGGQWNGMPLGGLGDRAVLSFGRGKGWTGGGGGALLDRGVDLPQGPILPPSMGATVRVAVSVLAQRALGRPATYGLPSRLPFIGLGETRFHAPREPRSVTRLAAGLTIASREASEGEADVRRQNVERLLEMLRAALGPRFGREFFVPTSPTSSTPGWLRLPILTPPEVSGAIKDARRLGIMPGYPQILPDLDGMHEVTVGRARVEGAKTLTRRLITVPTHSRMSEADFRDVVTTLARAPT